MAGTNRLATLDESKRPPNNFQAMPMITNKSRKKGQEPIAEAAAFSLEMLTAETLSNISFDNLSQLKELIDDEFMRRKAEESEVLHLHILKQCSVLGISVTRLLRNVQAQGLTEGMTIKYRGPQPGEVWHGKGVHPQWLKNYLAAGHKKEEYLVEA